MADNKEQKLKILRDGFWQLFEQTGDVRHYGRYKGAEQLLREHRAQKMQGQDLER